MYYVMGLHSIHDYYKKAGVAERAKLSNNYLLAHNNYLSTKNPKIIINLKHEFCASSRKYSSTIFKPFLSNNIITIINFLEKV